MTNSVPVITIDGPSGSGKGTVSLLLATQLGWHCLDSGALYRVLACAANRAGIAETEEERLVALAETMNIEFILDAESGDKKVLLDGNDVSDEIRLPVTSQMSSKISAIPAVREALTACQHRFRQAPGLVTDGRDMGTVIFPDATVKIFLIADVVIRAQRRLEQLKNKGFDGSLAAIQRDLEARDKRDQERAVAPLKPAADAHIIDSSKQSVAAVLKQMLALAAEQGINVE